MVTTVAWAAVALVVSVVALLFAEWRESRLGVWLAKPLASTLFIVIALLSGALDSDFGQMILLGLALSWLGDVLLMGKRDSAFVSGLTAFLLGHLAFTAAFITLPLKTQPMVYTAIPMLIVAAAVLRWLWSGVPRALRIPVVCYVVAIASMVIFAGGTIPARGPVLVAAAVVFAASDIFVARERFVHGSLVNRLWGLPLYYGAQLVLAMSVSTTN